MCIYHFVTHNIKKINDKDLIKLNKFTVSLRQLLNNAVHLKLFLIVIAWQ